MSTRLRIALIVLLVVVAGTALVLHRSSLKQPEIQPIATAHYLCDAGKTLTASFYRGAAPTTPAPGRPPVPTGSVALTLSDGRLMTLAQTISADGSRYANADESFVFWSKGNGALVLENNQQKSYVDCMAIASLPVGSGLSQVFATSSLGFSIRYPGGYTLDEAYQYQELGPGKDIPGVKFTIPASIALGTNLAADSYLSVEEIPQVQGCTAAFFLDHGAAREVADGGMTYSVASTTGAGAGNRYEETVYALPDTNPCIAVRYFIHYGVIENYPPGMVRRFDRQAILDQFDAIRHTLTIQ
ncbi:MAG: MliC family protein [Minisyncoccota bacterium]